MTNQNIKFSLMAIEAKDLLASDSNGFSDPYFKVPHRQPGVVDIPGKKNKTKTIKKTLNPVWNHTFDVEFNPYITNKLNIEVYDYDTFGKDDLIGSAVLPLDWMNLAGQDVFDQWIPLTVTITDKKAKTSKTMQKGSVHLRIQVKFRPAQLATNPPRLPPVAQPAMQPPMNQFSMPPHMGQPPMGQPPMQYPMGQPQMSQPPMGQPKMSQPPMGQPPMGQPNLYPTFEQISQQQGAHGPNPPGQPPYQPPHGQPPFNPPPGQPPYQPPHGQPPLQPPPGQPPYQPPPGQPPLQPPSGQPPYQPPHGQPPLQPPPGQPPLQPPPGQPPLQPPPGQPPLQPPPGQPPLQPPPGQPPLQPPPGQPPLQPPPGQPPLQPPPGQPPLQPPPGQPPLQPPPGQPPLQPPPGQPPLQPPPGQPPLQPPPGQPPLQPPPGQPPYQPPPGQPPYQPPPGQPPYQPPPGQPPYQPPHGQPPYQPPPGQPPYQPPHGQPLQRPGTLKPQPMFQPAPGQPPTLMRPPTFQQPMPHQPPIGQSMLPPQPYGPHGAPMYPPQYSQPPLAHSMMPPQMMPPHMMPPPMMAPHMMPPVAMPPRVNIITHRRGDALLPGSWIQINEPTVMVGLGWDFTGGETFDLDASITGFDPQYNVVESIYFSNKRGLSNSVIHFGDNTTGAGEGDDEVMKVILSKVPHRVQFLAVTINSYKKNSLIKARSAYIRLYTPNYHIGKYTLNRTKDCIGLLLGVFERDPASGFWYFRVMADPISGNKVTLSYDDIKTLLGSYSMTVARSGPRIVHPLPGEPLFEYAKWIKLPNRFTYVGLGWNIQAGFNYDLDASILTFDRMNNLMEIIYHENMQSYNGSILHYGDNRSGAGEGDDEVLSVDFAKIDPNVFSMAVIVNSFKGNSMVGVLDAFIRLYDTTRPLGCHVLKACPDCVGLCLGLFRKNEQGLWYFASIKDVVNGIVCTQSVNDVLFILPKYPLKI